MMHTIGIALAFVGSMFAIFMVSVFHAAAVEVSRKPRLAIVTNTAPQAVDEAEKDRELAAAA